MKNSMEDYYKVLQYLRETHIDRQYPYEFDTVEYIEGDCSLVINHASDFSNSLLFEDTGSIKIHLTTPHDYYDIDTFELLIYTTSTLTKDSLKIGFSNVKHGYIDNLVLDSNNFIEEESILTGEYKLLKYRVRNTTTKMEKKNRKTSSVSCINLYFNNTLPEFYLSNIVARTENYTITLEDLDEQIEAGFNYIINQLEITTKEEIPSSLYHLGFKSAAAYSWLMWWENEGKTMDDGTREGRNYATRLFDQIDKFIENYKETNPTYSDLNLELLGSTRFKERRHYEYYRRDFRELI